VGQRSEVAVNSDVYIHVVIYEKRAYKCPLSRLVRANTNFNVLDRHLDSSFPIGMTAKSEKLMVSLLLKRTDKAVKDKEDELDEPFLGF